MAWELFGIDAIRFSPADVILRDMVDAIRERGDDSFAPISPGERLNEITTKRIITQIDAWCAANFQYFVDFRDIYGKTVLTDKIAPIGKSYYEFMGVEDIRPDAKGWLLNAEWAAQKQEILDFMRCLPISLFKNLARPQYLRMIQYQDPMESTTSSFQQVLNALRLADDFIETGYSVNAGSQCVVYVYAFDPSSTYYGQLDDAAVFIPEDASLLPMELNCFYAFADKFRIADHSMDGIDDDDHFFLVNSIDCGEPGAHTFLPDATRASIHATPTGDGAHSLSFDISAYFRLDTPNGLQKVTPWVPPAPPEPEEE